MKFLLKFHNLYIHILNNASKKGANYVLAGVSFIEALFFPIPPDAFLIPIALAKPKKAFIFASIVVVFSILGGVSAYFIGYLFFDKVSSFIIYIAGEKSFNLLRSIYNKHGFLVVFIAGFTPVPYKLLTIFSGLMRINLWVFIIASSISRGARFYIIAFIIYKWGERGKQFIDKHFGILTLIIGLLVVLIVILYVRILL